MQKITNKNKDAVFNVKNDETDCTVNINDRK